MGALTMSKKEREDFLAETHIGVLAANGGDGAPVMTPIWYSYEQGADVVVSTDTSAAKTAALRGAGRATFCVQTETPPYTYVVIEGPVAISDGVDSDWRRGVARRYLGNEMGDAYVEANLEEEATAVTIRLTPEKWRTTDYNKLFA